MAIYREEHERTRVT